MDTSGIFSPTNTIPQASGRMSARVAAIFPVELVLGGSPYTVLPARSLDVGMGGICVSTGSILDGNLVHFVRFKLGRFDLELKVDSCWSSSTGSQAGPQMGFVFQDLVPTAEAAIWNFIQERALEIATFLRTCKGLPNLDFQDSLDLALATRIREVDSGQLVYGSVGDRSSGSIFAVFRGSIMLERATGKRNQEIAEVPSGEFFGGLPVIAGCPPFDRAVATRSSTLLEFLEFSTNYLLVHKPTVGAALTRAAMFHCMKRVTQLLDRTLEERRAS